MASFFRKLFGRADASTPDVLPVAQTSDATQGNGIEGMDHTAVLERAHNELALKTSAHDQSWHLGQAAWDVDLSVGTITFTTDSIKAVAPVQVIGTLDTQAGSWMWGWDHPSVPAPLGEDAEAVKAYGETRGIAELTTRVIPCDEKTAWDFTALACMLAASQGGYRGAAGATLVFMTFGKVTLSKAD